jgi:CRISPR-associated protein Cas2
MQRELNEIILNTEDQVLFISLGPSEGRGDRVITALGMPYVKLDAPCYVV